MRRDAPPREPWSFSVGFLPWKVTVAERAERRGHLYLWWREDGNWKKRSLHRSLRTERGRIDPEIEEWAKREAEKQYAALVSGVPAGERAPTAPLTILGGLAAAIDAKTGCYPVDTAHRREVERELRRASAFFATMDEPKTAWQDLKRADFRSFWRARIKELAAGDRSTNGHRGAEISMQRLFAVARWLRSEELIPATACLAPETWRTDLRDDWVRLRGARHEPEPFRPRYTLEEMRRYLAAAAKVDPRYHLLTALGAELRLGQVRRCRRPDLDLEHETLTVHSRGKKRGTVEKLTAGQMAVVRAALETGYLRDLEKHAPDYPLFPSGQMPGGRKGGGVATVERHANAPAIGATAVRKWHARTEKLAEIQSVRHGGTYRLRRAGVDGGKKFGISREALKSYGGWTDTQVPDGIYAEQDTEAAQLEARDIRAKVRGENPVEAATRELDDATAKGKGDET